MQEWGEGVNEEGRKGEGEMSWATGNGGRYKEKQVQCKGNSVKVTGGEERRVRMNAR